ncbi:MAG: hypothetical protein KatS3mg111_2889 [Pirellulaceae bacterium]|nr:MAG: hypothetical protein KatS3mg111_2889 [Pirellulaceae bacterium]
MFGPIFLREWLVAPRRARFYVQRVVFVASLFSLVCTAWALMAGIQQVRNIGDLSRFGALVFQIVAPLELIVAMFLAAVTAANSVCHEKDRRTLVLLLLTRLTNSQIVVGKLAASLVTIFSLILASAPLLLLIALMGGVTDIQVGMALLLIAVTSWWCGALANLIAFWREKTFQTLAITVLSIAGWVVFCEVIAADVLLNVDPAWATTLSPIRALWAVCLPIGVSPEAPPTLPPPLIHAALGSMVAMLLSAITVARLRVWNPSRELRPRTPEPDEDYLPGVSRDGATERSWRVRPPRRMWNNPVLWREVRTWAYGRKLLFIRVAYLALFLVACGGVYWSVRTGVALQRSRLADELVPVSARILAPFFVVSFVMINALGVNSVTNERDGQALDLLLATQITPAQFLFGKLLGVLYVTKEMVLLPIALSIYLWSQGGLSAENLLFVIGGLVTMDLFAAMLGIHCGMIYSQSRTAIATSLGTLFFPFPGNCHLHDDHDQLPRFLCAAVATVSGDHPRRRDGLVRGHG